MMVGWIAYVWDRPGTAKALAKHPPHPAELMFDRFDRNGDDKITKEEVPERILFLLTLSGVKMKESMNRQEFLSFYEEMRKRFPRNRKRRSQTPPENKSP